jgi:hypothetical protein
MASMTGIGGTPLRALPALANWPCLTTARCQPPSPSGRAATSSVTAASPRSRWPRHSTSMAEAAWSRNRAAVS